MSSWSQGKLFEGYDYHFVSDGCDTTRFLGLFRETWASLPDQVRQALHGYWRAKQEEGLFLRVELSEIWNPKHAYGQVGLFGTEIKFRASAFAAFPVQAARYVIAHELAHVYQKACGRAPGGDDEAENEKHAQDLAKAWGYPNVICFIDIYLQQGRSFDDACRGLECVLFDQELNRYHCRERCDCSGLAPEVADFKRRARLQQAKWRSKRGYPIGTEPIRPKAGKRSRQLGSRLECDFACDTRANLMYQAAREAADKRVIARQKYEMLNKDRLYCDLLSSNLYEKL